MKIQNDLVHKLGKFDLLLESRDLKGLVLAMPTVGKQIPKDSSLRLFNLSWPHYTFIYKKTLTHGINRNHIGQREWCGPGPCHCILCMAVTPEYVINLGGICHKFGWNVINLVELCQTLTQSRAALS